MYWPLCLLQAITFLEPLHGCAETDTPDICRQLAECHLKNGEPAAAVTVYESIVDSESTRGMKLALPCCCLPSVACCAAPPEAWCTCVSAAGLQITAGTQPSLVHGRHTGGLPCPATGAGAGADT